MRIAIVASVLAVTGCVTTPSKPEFEKAKVVDSLNDRDLPDWAQRDDSMFEEDGNVSFVTGLSMAGNSRTDGCIEASRLQNESQMVRHIRQAITTSAQVNQTSASDDPGYEALTAMLSQGTIQGSRVTGKHWLRVEESSESGERVLRLKCFTKVSVKKSELARQMREVTNQPNGNAQIRKKLLDAQSRYLDGIGSSVSETTEPAH